MRANNALDHFTLPQWPSSTAALHSTHACGVQALPTRPAVTPGEAADLEFRNGLPLCTDCDALAPASLHALPGADVAREPKPQAGSRKLLHAVLIYVPVVCVLSLLAVAVGVLLYRHKWRDVAGRKAQMGSHTPSLHGSTYQCAAATRADLGCTAVRPPLPSDVRHC